MFVKRVQDKAEPLRRHPRDRPGPLSDARTKWLRRQPAFALFCCITSGPAFAEVRGLQPDKLGTRFQMPVVTLDTSFRSLSSTAPCLGRSHVL